MASGLRGRGGARPLTVPSGARPTSARIRKSIFDILGQRCDGDHVLDLYAGSGGLGIEAALRGGAQLVLVEQSPEALDAIRRNVQRFVPDCETQVIGGDAPVVVGELAARGRRFDLILADPPYDLGEVDRALEALGSSGLLTDDGVVVLEHSPRERGPDRCCTLARFDERRYGQTLVSFYRRVEETSEEARTSSILEGDPT